MWQDIGLGDWLFDFDSDYDVLRMPEKVLEMVTQTDETNARVDHARQIVSERQAVMVQSLKQSLKSLTHRHSGKGN